MALNELAIRDEIVSIISSLNLNCVILNYDPVNPDYLVNTATGFYDAVTVECGDEQGRGQLSISRISGPDGDESGGGYRLDWMHVVRVYLGTKNFTYDQVLARSILIAETLVVYQTLNGTVDMMWSPPDLVEIDPVVVGSDGVWIAPITIGWSQFFSVVQV